MGEKVAAGDVLAGKYRVERVLGAGGMGVVVAARHVQLDFLVALKFMTDEALADPELVSRFLREARAAARLRSEHVARVRPSVRSLGCLTSRIATAKPSSA